MSFQSWLVPLSVPSLCFLNEWTFTQLYAQGPPTHPLVSGCSRMIGYVLARDMEPDGHTLVPSCLPACRNTKVTWRSLASDLRSRDKRSFPRMTEPPDKSHLCPHAVELPLLQVAHAWTGRWEINSSLEATVPVARLPEHSLHSLFSHRYLLDHRLLQQPFFRTGDSSKLGELGSRHVVVHSHDLFFLCVRRERDLSPFLFCEAINPIGLGAHAIKPHLTLFTL